MIYLIIYVWTCFAFMAGATAANMGFHKSKWDIVFGLVFSSIIVPYVLTLEIRDWWKRRSS